MSGELKLYMLVVGGRPKGRNTEQHDVFFGIAGSLKELLPQLKTFWPLSDLHIDSWREVTKVDGHAITITNKTNKPGAKKLFFINLGGYKENDMEEYHYKLLSVADDKAAAIKSSKNTAFYLHANLPGTGRSHVDDKFGIDVDDAYAIQDVLSDELRGKFSVQITPAADRPEDEMHVGYLKLSKIK